MNELDKTMYYGTNQAIMEMAKALMNLKKLIFNMKP